ncbi:MAG: hypothetical protein HDR04_05770 [Lachnospiraceae bacterium]|nr:hypothetical protein [Lachnospiraceae bacterium]
MAICKIVQLFNFFLGMVVVRIIYSKKAIDLCSYMSDSLERVPQSYIHCVSKNIRLNGRYPAGRRICFTTGAERVRIAVLYRRRCLLRNMSYIATSGVDVYERRNAHDKWCKCVAPDTPFQMLVSEWLSFDKGLKDIVMYLPPYAQISKIMLLDKDESVYFRGQVNKRLISVYGSSISQGCSASRPGLAYTNLLSRYFDADINNCAFSEGARGEKFVIDNVLLSKKSEVIIVEYDHNSSLEEFVERHLQVYRWIREYTDVPVIFLSRISGGLSNSGDENTKRITIIQKTLKYAEENNDKKVWFINGDEIVEDKRDLYLVDDRHPNDLGMKLIADTLSIILREKVFNLNDKGNA